MQTLVSHLVFELVSTHSKITEGIVVSSKPAATGASPEREQRPNQGKDKPEVCHRRCQVMHGLNALCSAFVKQTRH